MDIGVGDWVECLDASPHLQDGHVSLCVGQVYCVARLDRPGTMLAPGWMSCEEGVRLFGDTLPPHLNWLVARFRPIYRPRAETFRSLLEPTTIREDA